MAAIYPLTLEKLWKGLIDADGGDVCMVAVFGYTFDAAHEFYDDVSSFALSDPTAPLTGKDFTGGQFTADNPSIDGADPGDTYTGVITFIDTGTPSTSELICFEDRDPLTNPLSFTTSTGGPDTLTLPAGLVCSI